MFTKVASEGQTRRNQSKKRSLRAVNEHFEADFNAVWPSAVVCKHPLSWPCESRPAPVDPGRRRPACHDR
ncbi:hypothetical protein C1H69_13680 [Billgrantia endophytica]|uniref:Uncharacterized protein n=1 Tax=Billgrantia endophytica TaxID=2033802 RepID=A0A2N7U1J0_9GAMM|nr:hypothetical protein C1H69_13680 [Halomonas endophytica]